MNRADLWSKFDRLRRPLQNSSSYLQREIRICLENLDEWFFISESNPAQFHQVRIDTVIFVR